MNQHHPATQIDLKKYLQVVRQQLEQQGKKYGLRLAILLILGYTVYQKDMTIDLYLSGAQPSAAVSLDESTVPEVTSEVHPVNVSLLGTEEKAIPKRNKK